MLKPDALQDETDTLEAVMVETVKLISDELTLNASRVRSRINEESD